MVDFSTPTESDQTPARRSREFDPAEGRLGEPTASRMAAVINAIVSAVFVIAIPTVLTGMTIRFLGDRVSQQHAQQIILLVLGIGIAAWIAVMVKGIQLGQYLPGADFTGMREDD